MRTLTECNQFSNNLPKYQETQGRKEAQCDVNALRTLTVKNKAVHYDALMEPSKNPYGHR